MMEDRHNESSSCVVMKKKKNVTEHTKNVLFVLFIGLGLCHSFSPSTKQHSVKSNTIDILSRKKLSCSSRCCTRLFSTTIEKNPNIQSETTTTLTNDQEMLLQSLHSNIYGSLFINKVRELLEFKNVHDGSCLVPKRYKENPSLGELYQLFILFSSVFWTLFLTMLTSYILLR